MQKQSYFLDIYHTKWVFPHVWKDTSAVSVKSDILSNEAAAISFGQTPDSCFVQIREHVDVSVSAHYPKRLVRDEREVSYGCIFLTPFPRNPCIPQELPFGESCAEFKGHISKLFIITLLIVAAGQTDVKAVQKTNFKHVNSQILEQCTA